MMTTTYLEITMQVAPQDRPRAGAVYAEYRQPFLDDVPGARSKQLLIRDEDVQVLHGFESRIAAESYLRSKLFSEDIVTALKPLLVTGPDIRIYEAQ